MVDRVKIHSRAELERRIAEDGIEYVKARFVPVYADPEKEFAFFEKAAKKAKAEAKDEVHGQ